MSNNTTKPEENVIVKKSVCKKCDGVVRMAIKHMMDEESKNDFEKEVNEYNLAVKEQPFLEYRKTTPKWCRCPSWISSKPKPQQRVYVVCKNPKYGGGVVRFQTLAEYIPYMTVKEEGFMSEEYHGQGDYSKELDEYFTPEGFYEWQSEADMNWKISAEVTHWMPLIQLPDTIEEKPQAEDANTSITCPECTVDFS